MSSQTESPNDPSARPPRFAAKGRATGLLLGAAALALLFQNCGNVSYVHPEVEAASLGGVANLGSTGGDLPASDGGGQPGSGGLSGETTLTFQINSQCVTASDMGSGTSLPASECAGAAMQRFRVVEKSGGYAEISNETTGLCLALGATAGNPLKQLACSAADTKQRFRILRSGSAVIIQNRAGDLCLTAGGAQGVRPEARPCGSSYASAQAIAAPGI